MRTWICKAMTSNVTTYDGHRAAVRPKTLLWEGRRCRVAAVLSQAHTPDGQIFLVRTEDDQVFELIYSVAKDEWQIQQP